MSVILDAANEATRAPVPQMAKELQDMLGQRLVAYATGNRSPKVVGRWALGQHDPQEQATRKLRALFRTVVILARNEEPETIRAWLTSSNPDLDDEAPIELLRTGQDVVVFHAARNFIQS